MNGAHLHLLVNHISLYGLVLGAIVLGASMIRKSPDLRVLATCLFVIAGIFGYISFETGEKAEDVVKAIDAAADPLIKTHFEAAIWALRSGIFVGILALVTEWAACKKPKLFKALQWVLLVFAIHGVTVFVATAWHGGKVRHTELRDQ